MGEQAVAGSQAGGDPPGGARHVFAGARALVGLSDYFRRLLLFGVSALVYMAISYGAEPLFAVLLTLAFALSPPGFFYANQVYPEMPFALGLALGFMLMARFSSAGALSASLIAIALPWFSDRAIPGAFMLALSALYMGGNMKRRVMVSCVLAAGTMALAHYYYARFGVVYPLHHSPRHSLSISYMPEGLARLLLNTSRGFLWQAPVLALAPVAFLAWNSSGLGRPVFVCATLAFAGNIALVSAFPDWTGGVCPAGRYNVSITWLSYTAFISVVKNGYVRQGENRRIVGSCVGRRTDPASVQSPGLVVFQVKPAVQSSGVYAVLQLDA